MKIARRSHRVQIVGDVVLKTDTYSYVKSIDLVRTLFVEVGNATALRLRSILHLGSPLLPLGLGFMEKSDTLLHHDTCGTESHFGFEVLNNSHVLPHTVRLSALLRRLTPSAFLSSASIEANLLAFLISGPFQ